MEITKIRNAIDQAAKTTGSRAALARAIGVTPGAITQWADGTKRPNLDHWFKLIEIGGKRAATIALGVAVGTLSAWTGDSTAQMNDTQTVEASTVNSDSGILLRKLVQGGTELVRQSIHYAKLTLALLAIGFGSPGFALRTVPTRNGRA